jgi:drug/metabolite transporter (DMT)-like permease
MTIQALPYIVLLGFLFGSTLIASRFSVGQFQPTTYIGLRLALASLGHGAVYALNHRRRPWPTDPRLWRDATLLGIFGTAVPMVAIVTSLQYQSSGVTAALLTIGPAITVLMAHFFLADESLTRRKGSGVVLALGGALLLTMRGESGLPDVGQANPLGYGLVLLAMFCAGGMDVYARKFMRDFDSFEVASIRVLVATLLVMPMSAMLVGINLQRVNGQGYFALGYAALAGTFLAMFLAFYNVKRFGVTASAMTLYVVPVVAGLGGVLVLDEHISAGMVAGMSLIAAGIAFIQTNRKAKWNEVPP